jgi:hypothetical protein
MQKLKVLFWKVQRRNVLRAYEKWCPYAGERAVTVQFVSHRIVCLSCGCDH